MSFDPQPGDVYEEPSGLIVMVLRHQPVGTGSLSSRLELLKLK